MEAALMPRRFFDWTLRHAKVGWWLACLLVVGWPLRWACDRESPFAITGPVTVINARAGQEVFFDAPVRRDLDRECSAMFTRWIVDSDGFRRDFERDPRFASAEDIRRMDAQMNHRLQLAVPVPLAMPVGKAQYMTSLKYECNPLHKRFPIEVTMALEFEVLP
jgi:hypothetical protein